MDFCAIFWGLEKCDSISGCHKVRGCGGGVLRRNKILAGKLKMQGIWHMGSSKEIFMKIRKEELPAWV